MGVHRVEPRKYHRLQFFESGQRLCARSVVLGNGVADLGVRDVFDIRDQEPDLPRRKVLYRNRLRRQNPDVFDIEGRTVPPQPDPRAAPQPPVHHAH